MVTISINRNALLGVVATMIVSIACAAYFGLALGAAKLRANEAEASAADWKERAAETYQRMIFANRPTGQSALIPTGTIIDCDSELSQVGGRVVSKQKNCTFYPPRVN